MRRWGLILVLLLSLGVNLGVVGMLLYDRARPKPLPPEPRPPEAAELGGGGDLIARLPRFADYLGLEGKERQQFLDIQVSLFQETTRLRLRMAEIHRDLRRELAGEKPEAARADRLLRDSADVYLQMEKAFTQSVFASRRLLGEKQEKRYVQVLSRLRSATRGQLGLAPGGDDGGPMGPGRRGLEGPLEGPLRGRQRPGFPRFRQPGMRPPGGPPPAGANQGPPAGWQGGEGFRQQRMQRLQWRRMQRERMLRQGRPPAGKTPPPNPPPPVY